MSFSAWFNAHYDEKGRQMAGLFLEAVSSLVLFS